MARKLKREKAFIIEGIALGKTPDQIIAEGKAKGFSISKQSIYQQRYQLKQAGAKKKTAKKKPARKKPQASRRRAKTTVKTGTKTRRTPSRASTKADQVSVTKLKRAASFVTEMGGPAEAKKYLDLYGELRG